MSVIANVAWQSGNYGVRTLPDGVPASPTAPWNDG